MKRLAAYFVTGAMLWSVIGCNDRDEGTDTPAPSTPGTTSPTPDAQTPTKPPVSADEVKQQVGEAAEAIGQFVAQSKDEALKKADEQWVKLKADYEAWKVKAADASEEARAAMQKKMDAAGDEMAKLKESTGEAWKDTVQGVKNAFSEMSKALKEAKDEFRKQDTPPAP